MTAPGYLDDATLRTIFAECRQCGTCCRSYRKILLHPDEVDFIKKMGGHVGVSVSLNHLRDKPMEILIAEAQADGKVHMIHPDEKGCVFLQRRDGKYLCRISHHRPRACRGFRCTLADSSFFDLFATQAMPLLGKDQFGLPLIREGIGDTGLFAPKGRKNNS